MAENDRISAPRVGRRRRNVIGGRAAAHKVKVSAEEEAQLLRLAAEQGVTVPRLLIESALSLDARETPAQRQEIITQLFALHRLLGAVSNNVNQIAKATNATHESQPELFDALGAVRRIAVRIDDTVDELSLS